MQLRFVICRLENVLVQKSVVQDAFPFPEYPKGGEFSQWGRIGKQFEIGAGWGKSRRHTPLWIVLITGPRNARKVERKKVWQPRRSSGPNRPV